MFCNSFLTRVGIVLGITGYHIKWMRYSLSVTSIPVSTYISSVTRPVVGSCGCSEGINPDLGFQLWGLENHRDSNVLAEHWEIVRIFTHYQVETANECPLLGATRKCRKCFSGSFDSLIWVGWAGWISPSLYDLFVVF
jgi:hypothetical protein